jgi:hypothetical protein
MKGNADKVVWGGRRGRLQANTTQGGVFEIICGEDSKGVLDVKEGCRSTTRGTRVEEGGSEVYTRRVMAEDAL